MLPGRGATMGGGTWPFFGQTAQAGLGLYHLGGKRRKEEEKKKRRRRRKRRDGRYGIEEMGGKG